MISIIIIILGLILLGLFLLRRYMINHFNQKLKDINAGDTE